MRWNMDITTPLFNPQVTHSQQWVPSQIKLTTVSFALFLILKRDFCKSVCSNLYGEWRCAFLDRKNCKIPEESLLRRLVGLVRFCPPWLSGVRLRVTWRTQIVCKSVTLFDDVQFFSCVALERRSHANNASAGMLYVQLLPSGSCSICHLTSILLG